MSIAPSTSVEYVWFGSRAVMFEGGGSTGPQFEVLDQSSDFATRTLSNGTFDVTGSEWQQFLAFSGTAAEMAALGVNVLDGSVDTAISGQVNTTGDLRVGMGVEAYNIADMSGGGRLVDVTDTLDDSDDPIAITGLGKANGNRLDGASIEASDVGNRVVFSNELGFGLINGSGTDSGGSANALRLNDGDAINFEIRQGKVLLQASFTVKVVNSGSTQVILDSDGITIRDTNGDLQGGFVQDGSAGELNLGVLAHGTKVTINYVNKTIWFNGATPFLGNTSGFFDAFEAGGSKHLTLGSAVGNQTGWSADDLVLATEAPTTAPVNQAPVAQGYTGGTGNEDTVIIGDVNATDPNGDTLLYQVLGGDGPAHGGVVVNGATGEFTYTPAANYNGTDSFTVTISDGKGGSTAQLVTVTVNAVNDAPTVSGNTSGSGNEDTVITGDLDAADVDGDVPTFSIQAQGANGTAAINASTGGWSYTPNANFNGTDSFTVTISDGKGGSTAQLVTVTVNAVNDAPTVSGNTSGSGNEDTVITGDLDAADVDGDVSTFSIQAQGANGTAAINATTGGWTYTPNANFNGTDSFTVLANDGKGGLTPQVVSVTVNAVNDVPTVSGNTSGSGNEDTVITGDLDAADVDGDVPTFSIQAQGAKGTAAINASTGGWSYTPNANFNGTDSFTVVANDGNGGLTPQVVSVTVNAVNDPATFGGTSSGNVAEDGTLLAGGTLTVADVDGPAQAAFASTGTLTGTYGNFTFTLGTGAWTYTLRNTDANVQALNTGDAVQDSLTVFSMDGTSTSITVNIAGANEPVTAATLPSAFTGTGDPTDATGPGATTSVVRNPNGVGQPNVFTGTTGNDTIAAGNGGDTVYGYGGADSINGEADGDIIYGQAGADTILGDLANDALFGGSGADSISGGDGADTIVGGYGADTLSGGAGADLFRFVHARDTNDVIVSGGYLQSEDMLDFADLYSGTLGFNATASQGFASAYSVSWYNQGGNTIIIAELDGNTATAEFMLTIQSQTLTMAQANFIL